MTAFARLSDSFRLYAAVPVLSVCPATRILMSGKFFSDSATLSRVSEDSGLSFALFVSK